MADLPSSSRAVRFSVFEFDREAGELRRNGLKVKLHGQPVEVLDLLLERPGRVVTREELHQKLWSKSTFVDFEHGLNDAVKRLRVALGDLADNPRYVETVPRRGYRFIFPIEQTGTGILRGRGKPGARERKEDRPPLGRLPPVGQRLSHYHLLEKIGAGGMGEVYRATDMKLNRDVALKVLPEEFAKDADRMARFKREAQVLASLNHPNIASIYGLEEADDVRCLVLELVEGPTLAERIAAGPLPAEEALNIARQIAEALEAAHEKGIIHRDLKPANVKVTPGGTVKVLDFGLAKVLESDALTADLESSPTISELVTRTGAFLGTAAYMSPEQVRSAKVDKRADIWAFGMVLFEMLAGQRPFYHRSLQDTLAAVLRSEPDWDALPTDTPLGIRRLLRRCLEKDPKRRLRDISEARFAIEEHLAAPAPAAATIPVPAEAPQPTWPRLLPWAVAGVLALVSIVLLWSPWSSPTPPSLLWLEVNVSPEEPLFTGQGAAAVLSPDGKLLAYVAESGGGRKLYIRALEQLQSTLLPGTEGARDPFFSPDGRWVAFFTDNALKKVSVTGGAPLTLCETQNNRGGTWGPDDTIVFASHTTVGLSRIPATGGTPEEITTRSEGERSHRWPHFLPNGKAVLFMAQDLGASFDDATIEALVLATGERKVLHEGGTYPRYLPSGLPRAKSRGHLVYVREATLFAAPFDPDRLEVTGQPAPVLEGVLSDGIAAGTGGAQYAFSPTGTLVYLSETASSSVYSLVRADCSGKATPLSDDKRLYYSPRLSPDGRRVALGVSEGGGRDIWVYEIERGTMSRLTFQGGLNDRPTWTPDGQRIAFRSDRDGGPPNIYWKRADGAGEAERLTTSKNRQSSMSFSPDGKRLAFYENSPETGLDLWVLPLEGERKPELFLATPASEFRPEFSPDGRWIAYQSNESGRMEIYVRPYPGPGGKWQVSTNGGGLPRWTKNGRELIYGEGTNRWIAVPVTAAGDSFRPGKPQLLFEGNFVTHGLPNYDVSRDGRQFILFQRSEEEEQERVRAHLTFIFNFFDDLRRRVPTGKD